MNWTNELKERFLRTDPATYGHYQGVSFMGPKMKPINRLAKLVGPAYTVRLLGKDSCALYKAIEEAPAGSVIVVDHCGDELYACVGEMVARNAKAHGLVGIVIDGAATDSLWIEKLDFPVFCTGISVVTTNVWCVSGEYDINISCAGAPVRPGDIVFGDADGVVVVPPDNCEELLQKAEAAAEREALMRAQFERGEITLPSVNHLLATNVPQIIASNRRPKTDD